MATEQTTEESTEQDSQTVGDKFDKLQEGDIISLPGYYENPCKVTGVTDGRFIGLEGPRGNERTLQQSDNNPDIIALYTGSFNHKGDVTEIEMHDADSIQEARQDSKDEQDSSNEPHDPETDEHFSAEKETVSDAWEGVYLYTSWGYNQTNVDFARIVEVSDTGKTVVCKRCKAERTEATKTSEQVQPTPETYGDEFRLHVRASYKDEPVFKGSYPHVDGDTDSGTRKDLFMPMRDSDLYQTAPLAGH